MMTREGFGWDGRLYQTNSAVQFDLGLRAIEKLKLKGDEHILDIGCGNGMIIIELAKKIPKGRITAIELSKSMLKQAEANLKVHDVNNVKLVNMDANNIDFKNSFEVVFSNSAIHYLKDFKIIYRAIYNALKKNGKIMIQTVLNELGHVMLSTAEIVKSEEFKEIFKGFQMPWNIIFINRTKKILKVNSFEEIIIEPYKIDFKFDHERELINFLKAAPLVPLLEKIPNKLKDSFVDKYMKIYLGRVGENNFIVNLPRIYISAKKK